MATQISTEAFARMASLHYEFEEVIRPLAGYDDRNLLVGNAQGQKMVLKLCPDSREKDFLLAQNEILNALSELPGLPRILRNHEGQTLTELTLPDGSPALLRAMSYLEGELLTLSDYNPQLLKSLGQFLGRLDAQLKSFDLIALRQRRIRWDLRFAMDNEAFLKSIPEPSHRRLATHFLRLFRDEVLPLADSLPMQTIHGDANEQNLLGENDQVSGIIDFGDMVYSWRIAELGIALAYALVEQDNLLVAAGTLLKGYVAEYPLQEIELDVLYYMIAARLVVSVSNAAQARETRPEEEYLFASEKTGWNLLKRLLTISPDHAARYFREVCGFTSPPPIPGEQLEAARDRHFSRSMSLSYRPEPLVMERSALQYMYATDGRAYLDGVNNIMHVGHGHPRVVDAGRQQLSRLNTNTRYLYPQLTEYAEQLCAILPEKLEKAFFVNSGSAATDLALRLAQAHTHRKGLLVLEHGYHGNTSSGIGVSAYKYRGKGGSGPSEHIFEAPLPDLLRHFLAGDEAAIAKVAMAKVEASLLEANGKGLPVAAFIGESIVGCGGQVMLPHGYLDGIYARVRASGGLCIADEVQTGFGRVGSHFWAFEQHGVIPDIVILGKPMGNGHPMAAVVCTDEVAASFENGMEFFSSFGGNPVSCAIGLAVLEVIADEELQTHADVLGKAILADWREMQEEFEEIGDARGSGLFLGLELVKPGGGLQPDGELADRVVMEMRRKGVLLSTDGPWHNVIKFKPPMPFSHENAREMNALLREAIGNSRKPI